MTRTLLATSCRAIDRESSEPFYLQLAHRLGEAIRAGELLPGDGMPSESAMCREWNLSRATVRQALRTLEEQGAIRLVLRRGAFVATTRKSGWVLQSGEGFFEGEVDHDHRQVETEILASTVLTPPRHVSQALGLADGESGFMLRRRRWLDGQVAILSTNWLPARLTDAVLASEAMSPSGSLNRVLRLLVGRGGGARRSIEALPAPAEVAALLGVPIGAPLLRITSVTWDQELRPYDCYESWARTDRVQVTVEAFATC